MIKNIRYVLILFSNHGRSNMVVAEVVTTETKEVATLENTFIRSKDMKLARRLKIVIWGKPGLGKSYFALSCKEPVWILSTEPESIEPLFVHFPDKDLRIVQISKPYTDRPVNKKSGLVDDEIGATDPEISLREFEKVTLLLKDITEGTIIVDSVSDLWEWFGAWIDYNADKFVSGGQMMRTEWGKVNSKYKTFLNRLMSRPVDFVMTARSENIYGEGGKESSKTKLSGQKRTEYIPNIVMELVNKPTQVIDKKSGAIQSTKLQVVGIIRKARGLDEAVIGLEIVRPTYAKIKEELNKFGAGFE